MWKAVGEGRRKHKKIESKVQIRSQRTHNRGYKKKKPFVDDRNLVLIEWMSHHWMFQFELPLAVPLLISLPCVSSNGFGQIVLSPPPKSNTKLAYVSSHTKCHTFDMYTRKSIWYWITLQYFVCDEWQKLSQCVHGARCTRRTLRNSFKLIDN